MNKRPHLLLRTTLMLILLTAGSSAAVAQSRLIFRIDMRPQMKDSTFVPENSTIELTGNRLPFSRTHTVQLHDRGRPDSIYTATVHFPSLTNGQVLQYRYFIRTPGGRIDERRPRVLRLNGQKKELPVTRFNSFGE